MRLRAWVCQQDNYQAEEDAGEEAEAMMGNGARTLALRWRVSLLLTALAGTLIANVDGLKLFPLFPAGLEQMVPASFRGIGVNFVAVGWGIYVVLVATLLYVRKRQTVFIVFTLLCSLLMFNTVGCRQGAGSLP
jgi:hypothetical protein